MSEDVPIYLDRGQKNSSDSHNEKAERKRKFFTEEEDETLRRGLQRYGRANGQEYSKTLNSLHSKVEQSTL